ncbi:hypothetical protein IPM09_03545 [Candidatus Saccharibacteria bacterium]|nr:MAG: hypothetical protein IPM09_03545 [Candidatus Saccharibacteria bacterium]
MRHQEYTQSKDGSPSTEIGNSLPSGETVDGRIFATAQAELDTLQNHAGGLGVTPDALVGDYVMAAADSFADGSGGEVTAGVVGGLEVAEHPENSPRTARALDRLPIESISSALTILESSNPDGVAKVVAAIDSAIHDDVPNHEHNDRIHGIVNEARSAYELPALGGGEAEVRVASVTESEVAHEELSERVERAIDNCEFVRSPELERAIDGFYRDHDRLGEIIRKCAEGTIGRDERQILLDNPTITGNYEIDHAICQILAQDGTTATSRREQLQSADEAISGIFLNEVCVGAMTLEEEDIQQVASLHELVRQAAIREDLLFTAADGRELWQEQPGEYVGGASLYHRRELVKPYVIEQELATRRNHKALAHQDMRHAGQLLFHNTPNLAEITRSSFKLASRGHQYEKTGDFVTGSNRDTIEQHSNLSHWCEEYMPSAYKLPVGAVVANADRSPGTVAVPLAEIVAQAPYSARDIEYGVLEAKKGVVLDVTQNDGVIYGENNGSNDSPGRFGRDRVFLKGNRADQQEAAQNFELDFGRSMGTSEGNVSMILLTEDDVRWHGSMLYPFGAGEGYPGTVHLSYDGQLRQVQNQDRASFEARQRVQEEALTEKIRALQAGSIDLPQYRDRYVVPLRSGVMEFRVEGMDVATAATKARNIANMFG